MKALKIRKLKKSFKSNFLLKTYHILKDINLSAEKGEIYGFLGPNGAGKTTTMKCILGIIFPDTGEISIFDTPSHSKEAKKRLGFLPEHPYFYDYLTAHELLSFTGMLFSMPHKQIKKRTHELLQIVGLKGKENLKLRRYSKGMIQRVGLAQSLIHDPDIIILDEPFSGLDPIGRKELRDIIISLKDAGKTIFFSSHILQDMELIVDKVGIILDGRIIKEGRLSELISHSVESYEIRFDHIKKEILEAEKLIATNQDNKFFLTTKNHEEMNHIIQFILRNKGHILSVTPVKKTLEDIFLKEIEQ
jgi:ABC-2 type transport system ATP-binding protein